jgi:large subunit ribosomal protein L7A
MAYEQLLAAQRKTVGTKQTLKALERDEAKAVFIALNADRKVVEPVYRLCAVKAVPVIEAASMLELGVACGIEVGCAVAAVID